MSSCLKDEDGQQNSMQEAVSPCSSNKEWYWDEITGLFQVSCSSPYETRLSDWMRNWSREEKQDDENNNVRYYSHESDNLSSSSYYCPPECNGSSSIWDDGSLPIWDMD